jgi:excisionase family DNA binding protein
LTPVKTRGDQDSPEFEDLISLKEAAKMSGLTTSHFRRLAAQGKIWAKKLGRDWVTTEQAVLEYVARNRRPGPKKKQK